MARAGCGGTSTGCALLRRPTRLPATIADPVSPKIANCWVRKAGLAWTDVAAEVTTLVGGASSNLSPAKFLTAPTGWYSLDEWIFSPYQVGFGARGVRVVLRLRRCLR